MMETKKNDQCLTCVGNRSLIDKPLLAFFCSQQCPGEIIIKAQDWANQTVGGAQAIISGFHTPVEKEVLRILLRGKHPVIMCLARGLEKYRMPTNLKPSVADGSLLVISSFPASDRRVTAELADQRNRHILTMVDAVLIAHAAPDSKTFELAVFAKDHGKKLSSLSSDHNRNLMDIGAQPVAMQE